MGNVTQASPLRIKVDGDTSALDATTDNLVGSLAVDDRVRVHLHSDGIIVTGIQGGGNRSNPNLLTNSNFMVNQRAAVSSAALADGAYFLDRWKNVSGFGTSLVAFSDSGGVRSVTLGSSGNVRTIRQVVEQASIRAATHTLSWTGTALGRVYTAGATVPSLAASPITVPLDGTANVNVELAGEGQTVSDIKLERGAVATPYVPNRYDDELYACRRYYYNPLVDITNANAILALGYADASTAGRVPIPLTVPMRTTPTLITSGAFALYDGTTYALTAMTLSGWASGALALVNVNVTSGLTAGTPYLLKRNASATAALAFDAEL